MPLEMVGALGRRALMSGGGGTLCTLALFVTLSQAEARRCGACARRDLRERVTIMSVCWAGKMFKGGEVYGQGLRDACVFQS